MAFVLWCTLYQIGLYIAVLWLSLLLADRVFGVILCIPCVRRLYRRAFRHTRGE